MALKEIRRHLIGVPDRIGAGFGGLSSFMDPMQFMGKALLVLAAALAVVGAFLLFAPRLEFLRKIPGNFVWKFDGVTVYFPLALCIIISLILAFLFWLFGRRG